MSIRQELITEINELLAESAGGVQEREEQTFSKCLAGTDGTVVVFGAGRLGGMCARALAQAGITVRAFCDNNAKRQGQSLEGIEILSLPEAVRRHGSRSLFVIAIWTGNAVETMTARQESLQRLGCVSVISFPPLLWRYGRSELPFYALDLPSAVLRKRADFLRLAEALGDTDSLAALRNYLRRSLRAEFVTEPVEGLQYFPRDLFSLRPDEVFVDGGAYDGDTLRVVLEQTGGVLGKYHAIEPDPQSGARIEELVRTLPAGVRERIQLHRVALHSVAQTLTFSGGGLVVSQLSKEATIVVAARPLDELLKDEKISFLKLDIEGAETDALAGARELLQHCQPIVAVCVYHRDTDLPHIPLQLQKLLPDHRVFLRPHGNDGWELVCYLVPPERCLSATAGFRPDSV